MEEKKLKLIGILSDICPGIDFSAEKSLVEDGLIDSLDLVSIVNEIMEAFNVEINVDDLVPENFESADAIMNLIDSKS